MSDCVFCGIVAGTEPAEVVQENRETVIFRPLGPVCGGHVLVVPARHVVDAAEDPLVAATTMYDAARYASALGAECNIITSVGPAATQSVFHLHLHVVPRVAGDGLMVPWGTTGDPHAPHRCPRIEELEQRCGELGRVRVGIACRM